MLVCDHCGEIVDLNVKKFRKYPGKNSRLVRCENCGKMTQVPVLQKYVEPAESSYYNKVHDNNEYFR